MGVAEGASAERAIVGHNRIRNAEKIVRRRQQLFDDVAKLAQ